MMKTLLLSLAVAVLACLSDAAVTYQRNPGASPTPSSSHPAPSNQEPSYGYGGFGYGYVPPPYYGPPPAGNSINILDKLWERVNDVERGNKFAAEMLDALEARMSLLKNDVDDLTFIVFQALRNTDYNQGNSLDRVDEHLATSVGELENTTARQEQANQGNRNSLNNLERLLVSAKDVDVRHDGSVAILDVAVEDFKSKLFLVMRNEFEFFADSVEQASNKLETSKAREAGRLCETGTVTLRADDRRAEYVFQTEFPEVPGVIYSITGFSANLDERPPPPVYGYGPPPAEPNSVGCLVATYATKSSVTFQANDLSFGDTAKLSVDVDFQACSIGPRARPSVAQSTTRANTTSPTTTTATTTTTTPTTTTTTPATTTTTTTAATTTTTTTAATTAAASTVAPTTTAATNVTATTITAQQSD